MATEDQLHIYNYFIDSKGTWFCEGNQILDPDLLKALSRSLRFDGRTHWVRCQGETHPVEVADTPLIVTGLELKAEGMSLLRAEMTLNDGRTAWLAPPLWVGADNALYTTLLPSKLKARFNRRTFYQLTAFLQSRGDVFYISLAAGEITIKNHPPQCSDLH